MFGTTLDAKNYFKSDYEDWTRFQVRAISSSPMRRTGSKCKDLKSSPVRIGGVEMTKSLLKVR